VFLKLDVSAERITKEGSISGAGAEDLKKLSGIIHAVESAAYYDGYYFATGFSAASCRFVWCRGLECQALTGKGCRYKSRAYASMEAVGIDVFRLATSVGWEIYPIGVTTPTDAIPASSRYGIVLIQ